MTVKLRFFLMKNFVKDFETILKYALSYFINNIMSKILYFYILLNI